MKLSSLAFAVLISVCGGAWGQATHTPIPTPYSDIIVERYTAGTTSLQVPTAQRTKVLNPSSVGVWYFPVFNQSYYPAGPVFGRADYEVMKATAYDTNTGILTVEGAQSGTMNKAQKAGTIAIRIDADLPTLTPVPNTLTPTPTLTVTPTHTPTFIVDTHSVGDTRIVDAEWVPLTATNGITIAAGQTTKQFNLPLGPIRNNMTMCGFTVLGRRTSAGNTATLLAQMFLNTGSATTAIGPPVTIAGTSSANISTTVNFTYPHAVLAADNRAYFVNFTGTTAASTTLEVDGVKLNYWATPYPTPTP